MPLHFIFNINYINSPFIFSIGSAVAVGLIVVYVLATLFCLIYCVLIFTLPFCISYCLRVGSIPALRSRPRVRTVAAHPVKNPVYPRRSSSAILMKEYEKA